MGAPRRGVGAAPREPVTAYLGIGSNVGEEWGFLGLSCLIIAFAALTTLGFLTANLVGRKLVELGETPAVLVTQAEIALRRGRHLTAQALADRAAQGARRRAAHQLSPLRSSRRRTR